MNLPNRNEPDIEITTKPEEADAQALSRALMSFNRQSARDLEPDDAAETVFLFARSKGDIVGGLRALCFWNTAHIELLWVAESQRGRGLGTELLRRAEEYAVSKGFGQALLETTDWQAKPFYEKHGYQVFGEIDDYPLGHTCYFLKKIFSDTGRASGTADTERNRK